MSELSSPGFFLRQPERGAKQVTDVQELQNFCRKTLPDFQRHFQGSLGIFSQDSAGRKRAKPRIVWQVSYVRQHLGVEVVDALDGLFHVAALHRAPDLHPVCYRRQVHPRRRPRLQLKSVRRLNVPLAPPPQLRARVG